MAVSVGAAANDAAAAATAEADAAYGKVMRRIVPFLGIGFMAAYVDRVNVGFAKLQMLSDLGMSETVFGLGAGLFFLGYILCEVPSNMALIRIGARTWIARIMLTWGLLSGLMTVVHGPIAFYVVRFLLGVAEAGFMPGVLYYLAQWFPAVRRGWATALFMIGIPLASVVGGPLSGAILTGLSGVAGLAGWRWLFVLEAAPPILLGLLTFIVLPRSIEAAAWLTPREKALLTHDRADEAMGHALSAVAAAFRDPRVWLIGAVDGALLLGLYTVAFWFPTLLRDAGLHNTMGIGLLTAAPHVAAVVAMLVNGWHSDRTGERRWHIILPILIGALALALSPLAQRNIGWTVVIISIANAGILGALPPFWTLPSVLLRGAAAAAGLALAGSIANVAGFFATFLVGWLKDLTHSTDLVVLIFAAILGVSALAVLCIPRGPSAIGGGR
jgi:sugar phosphate permease